MVATLFESIRVSGFRNLHDTELKPGAHFNIFSGHNGAGKSNVLEAIYYLSALRSFRTSDSNTMLKHGCSQASMFAKLSTGNATHALSVALNEAAERRIELDGKRPRGRAQWMRIVPAVLFHPGDLRLVSGGAEGRRAWIDRILEQIDPVFSASASAYERALRSRNRLLKEGVDSRAAFAAYNDILSETGAVIAQSRTEMIQSLGPRTTHNFQKIFSEAAHFEIKYKPNTAARELAKALQQSFSEDVARGYTTKGVHRDEIDIEYEGTLARDFASQGQQRAITLALKLAELDALTKTTGKVPLLLLDDVSSELDYLRNEQLFARLAELGGQVFLSTTHPEFIRIEAQRTDFVVSAGVIENQTHKSQVPSRALKNRQR